MIPSIIHYCWFGGSELPQEYANYIGGWKELHPSWEIKQWDETNTPFTCNYIKTAAEKSHWSNCSNYVRLWALKEFGGIYLDTDFKLLKPLDELLDQPGFLGFEQALDDGKDFMVNNAIVGAIKNNSFIVKCYEELLLTFDGTEKSNLSGPGLTTEVLKTYWNLTQYGLQQLKDITVYPVEYFYPIHIHKAHLLNKYTEHIFPETYGIHMWGRSWVEKKDLIEIVDYLNYKAISQEVYIKRLEEELVAERKKMDEIWFWKNHFEEKSKQQSAEIQNYNHLLQEEKLNVEELHRCLEEARLQHKIEVAEYERKLKCYQEEGLKHSINRK